VSVNEEQKSSKSRREEVVVPSPKNSKSNNVKDASVGSAVIKEEDNEFASGER